MSASSILKKTTQAALLGTSVIAVTVPEAQALPLVSGIVNGTTGVIGANAAGTSVSSVGVQFPGGSFVGSLDNSGIIVGSAQAVEITNNSNFDGVITNTVEGMIGFFAGTVATTTAATGIAISSSSSLTGGVVNSGTIQGTAFAINVTTGSSVTGGISNAGLISASIGTGIFVSSLSSIGSITNSGIITGGGGNAILFDNGDSSLILRAGSTLNGNVDGGTGTNDTLVLEGYGSEDSIFTNFENLTVSASSAGTWVLLGNSDFDALTVNSGTLDVRGVISVDTATVAGGTLNISSGGILNIDAVVAAGDLHIDGALNVTSGVTVGGVLSGDATITGSGTLLVNGVLSPGNSPGTITTALPLVQGDNSTYVVEHEAGASPETDNVVVSNTATIGNNVNIELYIGAGSDGFFDTILTATGGVTGAYDGITGSDNLVALVLYPDANTVTIVAAKTDALAATAGTVSDAGFVFLDNLQEGARRDGRVWATAYIYNAENEGLGQDGADYDQDAFGFNAGVDVISQPNFKVGVAVGYIDGEIDIDSATSDADNDGIFGAAYLNYMNDNFYLDGALMIGQQTVDTTRTLTAGDATASIDATSYGANLEAGFELEALGGRLSPFVKVGIHSASLDAYSEAGAAGAMTVGEVETQQMRVGGGFRYAVDLGSADGIQVTPAIKVGMTQEWQEGDSSADIGFVGYTGSTSASLDFEDQTTVDLGLSFDVKLSQAVTAFVGWDAALGDETTRNTGTIGLSVNW